MPFCKGLILLSVELARGLRAAAYQSKINKMNTMTTAKLILILALASSLAACFGVSSSDDADDNANGGNGNGGEGDTETFANCPEGNFQSNDVNFIYAAFDHGTTQEVTHTQEDDYANTVSKLTLECNNAVVSEQENSFSQESTENTLDVALIIQYLTEEGYTKITSASVTFQPLAQAADTNYSYQVNAEVNAEVSALNIYAIGNSQVGQNFMVAEATIAANAYLAADENDKTQMNLSASYLSGTANDQNISAIITSGIKLSQLEQQLEDLEQNGDFITTSGAILSYIASNSTSSNSEQAYLTRDDRDDHGSPIHSMGIALGSGPSFTAFGNPYLIDNEGNKISIKAKSDGGAVGSLSNGTYSLPAGFANSTDGIIRTDGEDLANGSYVLAQQFSDNSGAYHVVNLGIFLKGTKAPPTGISEDGGSIDISSLEHCAAGGDYDLESGDCK